MSLRMRTQHLGAKIVFENTCGETDMLKLFSYFFSCFFFFSSLSTDVDLGLRVLCFQSLAYSLWNEQWHFISTQIDQNRCRFIILDGLISRQFPLSLCARAGFSMGVFKCV